MEDFLKTKDTILLLQAIEHYLKVRDAHETLQKSIRFCLSSQGEHNLIVDVKEKCMVCGDELLKDLHCTSCGNNFEPDLI